MAMMNKRYGLLFNLIFLTASAFAQDEPPVYYTKNNTATTNRDSAEYYRVINSKADETFRFTEYHKDGTWRTAEARGDINEPVYVSTLTFYYKTGQVAIKSEYKNGRLLKATGYYPNAVLMHVLYYPNPWPFPQVAYDADSSGTPHIVNGNGSRQESDSLNMFGEHFTMAGSYKNGWKDGVWKGTDDKGLFFEQTYQAGRFISGTTITNTGKKYHYHRFFELPRFSGDFNKFEYAIAANLKHPADTAGLEFLTPGYLHLSYVINEKGEITNLHGFKKQGKVMINLELKSDQPKCKPAMLRGVPVPYPIADNADSITRGRLFPFHTDVYLKGAIVIPDSP
jgi:antitoxin component YwqK of YwqJK toxin-antitoxin module